MIRRTWICWILPLTIAGAFFVSSTPPLNAAAKPPAKAKKTKKKVKRNGFRIGPKSKTEYVVDPESNRNQVTFTSKAAAETFEGNSTQIKGHLEIMPRKLTKAAGEFTVEWKSLDTGNPMKNSHMLSPPWIDAEKYPQIVFKVSGIKDAKRKTKSGKSVKATLLGKMAMNGAEKEMSIPATIVYVTPDESKKKSSVKEGIGIRCHFKVALADFNIQGRGIGQGVAAEQQIKVSLFLERAKKPEGDKEKKKSPAPKAT